jgi:hypothetical protein
MSTINIDFKPIKGYIQCKRCRAVWYKNDITEGLCPNCQLDAEVVEGHALKEAITQENFDDMRKMFGCGYFGVCKNKECDYCDLSLSKVISYQVYFMLKEEKKGW